MPSAINQTDLGTVLNNLIGSGMGLTMRLPTLQVSDS